MAKPAPSSTSLPDTAASPSPSRPLDGWPTPRGQDSYERRNWKTVQKINEQGGDLTLPSKMLYMTKMGLHLEPSPSRRSTPMPLPSSPTAGPMSPTSGMSETLRRLQSLSDVVFSHWWSRAGSPANPTAPPGSDSPEPTNAISGTNVYECFGSFVPGSPSGKTSADSLVPNHRPRMVRPAKDFFSTAYCQTWPTSGMVSNGMCYRLPKLEPPTAESGSGSSAGTSEAWPTASARDWKDTPGMAVEAINPDGSERKRLDQLARAVYETERSGPPRTASGRPDPAKPSTSGSRQESWEGRWPTPATRDHHAQGATHNPKAQSSSLATVIEKKPESWATPRTITGGAESAERKQELGRTESGGGDLQSQVQTPGGKLNPGFVEALMGLPLGHTQLPRKFVKPKGKK